MSTPCRAHAVPARPVYLPRRPALVRVLLQDAGDDARDGVAAHRLQVRVGGRARQGGVLRGGPGREEGEREERKRVKLN